MKLDCQYVSAGEAGGEIFQVLFEAERDQKDGPYLLLQRASFGEDEGDDDPCYVETNDERLIGHYPDLDVTLTRNRLTVNLPLPVAETIEADFKATDEEFEQIRRTLGVILQ
jgi:hypothetical protein